MSDYIKKVYFLYPKVNYLVKVVVKLLYEDKYLFCVTIVAITTFTILLWKAGVWWYKRRRRMRRRREAKEAKLKKEAKRLKKARELERLTPKPTEVEPPQKSYYTINCPPDEYLEMMRKKASLERPLSPCTLLRKIQNNEFSSEHEKLTAFLNAKREVIFEKYPFMKNIRIRSSITDLAIKLMKEETEDNRMPYYYGVTKIMQELGDFGKVPSDISINSISTYYSESDLQEEERRQEERFKELDALLKECQRGYKLDELYEKVESLKDIDEDNIELSDETDDTEEYRRFQYNEHQTGSSSKEFVSVDKKDSEHIEDQGLPQIKIISASKNIKAQGLVKQTPFIKHHYVSPRSRIPLRANGTVEPPGWLNQKLFPKSREGSPQSKIRDTKIISEYLIKKQSKILESTPKEVKEAAVVKDVKKSPHTEIYREYLHKQQPNTSEASGETVLVKKVIRDAKISPHAIIVEEYVPKTQLKS